MDASNGMGSSKIVESDVVQSNFNIFTPAPLNDSFVDSTEVTIYPTSNNSPYTFDFRPLTSTMCLEMESIRLHGKIKIVASGDAPKVDISNCLPASLFSTIEESINGRGISNTTTNISPYQHYIQKLVSYGIDAQRTSLLLEWFRMDTASYFDDIKAAGGAYTNTGAKERSIAMGEDYDFVLPLAGDFLQSGQYLHPALSFLLRLTREKDTFGLIGLAANKDSYKIELSGLHMTCRYLQIKESIIRSQNNSWLQKKPILYPIIRSELTHFQINANATTQRITNIFPILPKQVIFGFVDAKAFNGDITKNPFNFQHFDLEGISLDVNGRNYPAQPLEFDWTGNNNLKNYYHFKRNTGDGRGMDLGSVITPKLYNGGCSLFAFDLSPDQCNMMHMHPAKKGTANLSIQFKTPLAQEVILIAYASRHAHISVLEDGGVVTVVEQQRS